MYRMLSPSAEDADADMDIATPRGTGGFSPPPAATGTRQVRPPGALLLLAQASLGAGVVAGDDNKTNVSTAVLNSGAEDHVSARGRQPEPRPARTSVLSMLTTGSGARRSRSRVPQLD
eukprot:6481411-Amphidinium_carterae.1